MFDPSRFLRLARAQWSEQRRSWLWFIGILLILHFVLLLLTFSLAHAPADNFMLSHSGQEGLYFTGLFLTAPIFAGRYFIGMARPESAGVLLMRPASLFEKWLLAAAVVLVAYPLAYSLAFNVLNLPSALYVQAANEALAARAEAGPAVRSTAEFRLFLPWHGFDGGIDLMATFLVLATLQGFALLGSLYFRAMPFIKTILAGFILLLVVLLVVGISEGAPDLFLTFWEGEGRIDDWRRLYFPLAWFAVPGLLWLGALFALQEREVA